MTNLKKYIAECIGTFVLVFFACGTAVVSGDWVAIALAFGLVIIAMAFPSATFPAVTSTRPFPWPSSFAENCPWLTSWAISAHSSSAAFWALRCSAAS